MSYQGYTVDQKQTLEPSTVNSAAKDSGVAGSISSSTSGTVSPTTASANELILVWVAIGGTQYVSSVSDTNGLTWKLIAACQNGTSVRGELWGAIEPTARSHTITVTLSASGNAELLAGAFSSLQSFSGQARTTALQIFPYEPRSIVTSTSTGTTPSVTAANLNPQDMMIGLVACLGAPTLTVGSGYTTITSGAQSTNVSAGMEYQKLTAANTGASGTTANTVNYTLSTSEAYVMMSIALVAAGNNGWLIQAASGHEFTLNALYSNGQVLFWRTDGYLHIDYKDPTQQWGEQNLSWQITTSSPAASPSPNYAAILNTSASPVVVEYEGVGSV